MFYDSESAVTGILEDEHLPQCDAS